MLRKITSLLMLFSFFIMSFTGIVLFIAPPGRVAHWVDWGIFGFTKEEHSSMHTTFMVLFIIFGLLHILYNYKPILYYLKNKSNQKFISREFVISLFITFIFIFGTLKLVPPFGNFLDFSDSIQNSWAKTIGEPPYNHAELASLEGFCKKTGIDISYAKEQLGIKNIKFDNTKQTLKEIAKANKISPNDIYNIINNAQ